MVFKFVYIFFVILLFFVKSSCFSEINQKGWNAGISFSFLPSKNPGNFNFYEIEGSYLTDIARYEDDIIFMLGFGGATGVLHHKSENGFVIQGKVEAGLGFFNNYLMVLLSTGPGFLTRYRYKDHNFGGPLTFLSSAGMRILPWKKVGITYRFQHMSNAHLFKENNHLNLHILGLNYFF